MSAMKINPTFFLLVSLAFILLLNGCFNEETIDGGKKKPQSLATVEQVKIRFTENGILQAILYSDRLEERDKLTWGWVIKVDFFTDTDTIPDGAMIADSGVVHEGKGRNRREVSVFGNVKLDAPDGTILYSDSLRWNPRTQKIESKSKVKVIRGKEIIEGVGFTSDPGFEHIRIINVKGRLEEL